MFYFIPICLFIILTLFIIYQKSIIFKGVYYPPKYMPIIGNTIEFMENIHRFHDWRLDHSKKAIALGQKCWQYSLFGRKFHAVELLDPDLLKYILKDNVNNFGKGGMFNEIFHDLLGNGIFNSDGDTWRMHRQLISPIFSVKRLTQHIESVLIKNGNIIIEILNKIASSANNKIDIQDLFFRYTFDCICEIAFGFEANTLKNKRSEFSNAFDRAQQIIYDRLYTLPIIWKSKRMLSIGSEKELAKCISVLDNYILQIIENHKDNLSNRNDLLSVVMENSDCNTTYLKNMILNIMLAGRDTTACTLTWLFSVLSTNVNINNKLCDEISNMDNNINYDNIKKMKYLEATISETLRLYPAVPLDGKIAVQKCVLPNGLHIPAGTNIIYSPYIINRLESLWGKDMDEFIPERWMKETNITNISSYRFPTFNGGTRLCLGKSMALSEIKILTCMLLNKFRFTRTDDKKLDYNIGILLSIKNGLTLHVHKR
ncbi:MAG: CYP86A7 [Edafosvirus sp.]|uniref:CYP86A7 n=1 Tax=Edafosvirus sp. TaxID=2487765 RepID=A0A3G4ZVT4_9VIRU|nr:MAG: CYP86A7 [Edafosvirus sp.]